MSRPSQRGSALLLSVVVVLVVAVVGVAVIRFASGEVAGAAAGSRHQALVACAEAGRQMLVSQFKAIGADVTSIEALNVPLDAGTRLRGGHFDSTGAGAQVAQVTRLPGAAFGPPRPSSANWRITGRGTGGQPYKVVVHCQTGGDGTPTSGRQLEVEFGVRFGL
jgi:type II secretory pathway pseudopilin PulG